MNRYWSYLRSICSFYMWCVFKMPLKWGRLNVNPWISHHHNCIYRSNTIYITISNLSPYIGHHRNLTICYAANVWNCFQLSGDVCVGGVWDLRPRYVNHQIERRKTRLAIACQLTCLTWRTTTLKHSKSTATGNKCSSFTNTQKWFGVGIPIFNWILICVRLIAGMSDTKLGAFW